MFRLFWDGAVLEAGGRADEARRRARRRRRRSRNRREEERGACDYVQGGESEEVRQRGG